LVAILSTLNDHNTLYYPMIDPYCQRQRDSSGSIEFSDVQIMHKFAGQFTPN